MIHYQRKKLNIQLNDNRIICMQNKTQNLNDYHPKKNYSIESERGCDYTYNSPLSKLLVVGDDLNKGSLKFRLHSSERLL